MFFVNEINNKLEFKIIGYQFPDKKPDSWDNNWLNIYIKVDCTFGQWEKVDPSLLTWEVEALIEWLESIYTGNPTDDECYFTEPNLSFKTHEFSGKKFLRVIFMLESKPKSIDENEDCFIDFELTNKNLQRIVADLKSELSNFPKR